MDTYRIRLFADDGHCDIDANSFEEAVKIALGLRLRFPMGSYVDDSVAVDYEVLKLGQDKKDAH